jgi:hypothetical protein
MRVLAGLVGLALVVLTLPVTAGSIAADALPLPNRLAAADMIVVGKVTAVEDQTVKVAPFPGAANKVEYKVVTLTVGDPLMAPKETKTVRLAYVPIPPNVAINPAPLQPTVGMEGVFFLTHNADAGFYTAQGGLQFLAKNSPTFEKDVTLLKRCVKLLEDPNASLKSKEAEDRFLTAAILVARYRMKKVPTAETELVDAEQSKLILQALAGADWTPPMDFTHLSPLMVFGKLPLTEKEGWTQPKDPKTYPTAAQQWVKEHAGTYRIPRFVAEKK